MGPAWNDRYLGAVPFCSPFWKVNAQRQQAQYCLVALDLGPDSAIPLGVDAIRYSFIVMDLHHLLLAGLPAHSGLPSQADRQRSLLKAPSGE